MSPLKISLLLRMHAYVLPNADIPEQQALSSAMGAALVELVRSGMAHGPVLPRELVYGPPREWLTDKGRALVKHLCAEADSMDASALMINYVRDLPPLARPAQPATKPARRERPDYETMLRDDFAMGVMRSGQLFGPEDVVCPEQYAKLAYRFADAMMAERSKAK